jgi:hypothetical protein
MLRTNGFITLDMSAYSLFAVIAGLTLLMGADHASPGCTGPVVERCDYIETAKAANSGPEDRHFESVLGFNVFDQGSSVVVQQSFPAEALVHASAVRIDKKSCRPCEVVFYGHLPPPLPGDPPRGRLIQSLPAVDAAEAARLRAEWASYGYPITMDVGTPAERGTAVALTPADPPS